MAANAYRVIYNCDSGESFRRHPAPSTEEQICMVVDELKGTAVDAFCYAAGEWVTMYPSKVREQFGERVQGEGGAARLSDSAEMEWLTYQSLVAKGTTPLEVLCRRARSMGMDFYASIRMNDTHQKTEQDGIFASRFWREHPEYRLWELKIERHGSVQWYYNAAMDYSIAAVRAHFWDAIIEMATMFDVDGIELDFCRNPFLFNPSEAWEKRAIATNWLGELRDAIRKIGRDKGHELKIIIRAPSDRAMNVFGGADLHTHGGIDLRAWIENKLADIFVVSDFHENDYRTDFTQWRDLARAAGVGMYPGLEISTTNNGPLCSHHVGITPDDLRGVAHNYLAQDVDGLYLFNFPCLLTPIMFLPSQYGGFLKAMREIHDLDKLEAAPRDYVFYEHLPIELDLHRPARFHQTVPLTIRNNRTTDAPSQCTLTYKVTGMPDPQAVRVLLNDEPIDPAIIQWDKAHDTLRPGGPDVSPGRAGFDLGAHYHQVTIALPPGALKDGDNTLGWELTDGPATEHSHIRIHELEARVHPADSCP